MAIDTPSSRVPIHGVRNVRCRVENIIGNSPSRAMAKKTRVWP